MMHKHGIMGLLSITAWGITALAAVNIGTAALGKFDFFTTNFMLTSVNGILYTQYLIGAAGLYSLFGFVRVCISCVRGGCGANCNCNCNNGGMK